MVNWSSILLLEREVRIDAISASKCFVVSLMATAIVCTDLLLHQ